MGKGGVPLGAAAGTHCERPGSYTGDLEKLE